MRHIVSTCPSSASTQHDLYDDTTRIIHSAYTSLEARLKNTSLTCFQTKQAARSRCVSHADLTSSVLWHNRQTDVCLFFRHKPRNCCTDFFDPSLQTEAVDFKTQTRKTMPPVLREKPSTLVLRINQKTRAPRLLVHGVDYTQRHLTS
jgi:hypothetical protein